MDTSIIPALIGFLVVGGVATAMALATLVVLATESRRRPTRPVVAISAGHPAAATARRAA